MCLENKKFTVLSYLFFCWFLCLTGCSSKQHKPGVQKNGSLPDEPHISPGLRLLVGAKYYYSVNNVTYTRFDVNDNKIESTNTVDAGLIYQVLKDSAGGFLIKMTYDRFKVGIKTADSEKEIDSENGNVILDPVEHMLRLLKGSSMFIWITHEGNVRSVNGYKELADKVINNISVQNPADKPKMQEQLQNMLGENFIKNNMEQGFGIVPDSAAYPGDTWTKHETQFSGVKLDMNSKFTLSSIDGTDANIESYCKINVKDSGVNVMSYAANVDLRGEEEGSYRSDINTGMLLGGTSTIDVKGAVQIQLKDIPTRIKIKKTIAVKKM